MTEPGVPELDGKESIGGVFHHDDGATVSRAETSSTVTVVDTIFPGVVITRAIPEEVTIVDAYNPPLSPSPVISSHAGPIPMTLEAAFAAARGNSATLLKGG